MLGKTRDLLDETGFEPADDGGKAGQRAVIVGALLGAGAELIPLFESIEAAFDAATLSQ